MTMMRFDAVADTSFIIALLNRKDRWHRACQTLYRQSTLIALPQTTLAEVGYLLRKEVSPQSVRDFLYGLTESQLQVVALEMPDLLRTAEILERYADTRIDFVDASIAALAERLNIITVLTLDRRDFSLLRPRHTAAFQLLPETVL